MRFTALAVTAVVFATLTLSLDSTPTSGGSGKRLCVTREWQGGQALMTGIVSNGKREVTRIMTMVSYSAIQKKIQAFELFTNDPKYLLFDYPAGYLYTTRYVGTQQTCVKTPLTGPFVEQCVPDNHTMTVDSNTGYGAGVYVTFGWEAQGTLGDLTYHVTMSNDNLPIFEEIYGKKDGVPFFQNAFFYNASRTTFSKTSFAVPDSCKHL